MTQSITHYVDVSVSLEGTGPQPAGFGTPCFIHETNSVGAASRLHGPFLSVSDVVDFGYAVGSPPHAFASRLFAQQPRVRSFYVGRADTGDANLTESLTEIVASNPGAFYALAMENRDESSIIELADFVESQPKIAIAQSSDAYSLDEAGPTFGFQLGGTVADGTYSATFTGFGLVSPVVVSTSRTAGTPATLELVMDDLATAIEAEAGSGQDLEGIVDPDSVTAGVRPDGASNAAAASFEVISGEAGTVTYSAPGTATVTALSDDAGGVARRLFDGQYTRTALAYYHDDTEYLDAAWMSRCLSFNLDQQKGIWSYKRLNGIEGSSLRNNEVQALRNRNVNYFAPAQMSAGNRVAAFTAQGWFPSGDAGAGRRIDVTISLDFIKARLEEAFTGVLLREPFGVLFSDAGIGRFVAAFNNVMAVCKAAGHVAEYTVPEGEDFEGLKTPAVFAPKAASLSVTERTARTLTFSGLCYLQSYIEKVVFSITVRQ